jgi:short-subunit dehydrogenase
VGAGVRAVTADLARPLELAQAIGDPAQLDALVYCAGVSIAGIGPVAATDAAVWQETMAVNVLATAELTRLVLPALRRSRGHVLFVNSARGVRAVDGWSAFAASKAALQELADSLGAGGAGPSAAIERRDTRSSSRQLTVVRPGYLQLFVRASAVGSAGARLLSW